MDMPGWGGGGGGGGGHLEETSAGVAGAGGGGRSARGRDLGGAGAGGGGEGTIEVDLGYNAAVCHVQVVMEDTGRQPRPGAGGWEKVDIHHGCMACRLTAEIMMEEIGRRPGGGGGGEFGSTSTQGSAVSQDREAYALAAGLALGLISLGKGHAAVSLSDLRIEERLRCCTHIAC